MADNNQNEQKRILLKQLIDSAMGGSNKSLQEIISDVKGALETYKNFAKEWDNLEGKEVDEVIEGEQDLSAADVVGKEDILRQMIGANIEANQAQPPSEPQNLQLPRPLPPVGEIIEIPSSGVPGPVPLGMPGPMQEGVPPPMPLGAPRPMQGGVPRPMPFGAPRPMQGGVPPPMPPQR
jgi:hypothetical protein